MEEKTLNISEELLENLSIEELAELIFSDVTETIEDLEKRYPKRNLSEDALVTRFAPSPTGFLHTGSLFTSLIGFKMANQSRSRISNNCPSRCWFRMG